MNNFQSNRQRDNRGFREMHQATCSQCGKDCQVPFRPTGDKPVYCSDCYEKLGNNSNSWSYGDDRPQRPSYGDRNSGGNRSFSNNRDFGGGRNFSNNRGTENRSFSKPTDNRQMEMVAKKLDRIIELLEGQRPVAKMVEKTVENKIEKKPAKKAKKTTKKTEKKK